MPLPTARHAMPDLGAARGQGSGADACAHPQIGGLLWRGQSEHRQVRACHVREVRRGHIRELPEEAPATSLARKAYGSRAGQRQIPPCHSACALASAVPKRAQSAVSAAIQPAVGTHRARLEARSPHGHAQPFLRHAGRIARRGRKVFRPLAISQFSAVEIMRHYLRRYV
jgi:hypothetical protein